MSHRRGDKQQLRHNQDSALNSPDQRVPAERADDYQIDCIFATSGQDCLKGRAACSTPGVASRRSFSQAISSLYDMPAPSRPRPKQSRIRRPRRGAFAHGCRGPPGGLSQPGALEQNIPVIAVRENRVTSFITIRANFLGRTDSCISSIITGRQPASWPRAARRYQAVEHAPADWDGNTAS